MSKSLLLAALVAAAACGGSSKPVSTAPLPDDTAETRPADPAEPTEPAEPVEPSAPEPTPIAAAPPPVEPGAPRPHVAKALAFLPADAQLIVGIDVPRIIPTPLGQMFLASLTSKEVPEPCRKLTAAQFGNVVFGGGGGEGVAVADGKLPEKQAVACIAAATKARGEGKLEQKKIAGRTVRYVDGDDGGWIAWSKSNVPLFATNESAMTAALDPRAAKVSGDIVALSSRVDHARMVWVAAVLPAGFLAAMGMPDDTLSGDVSVRAWADIGEDSEIDVVLGFASPDDAARIDTQIRTLISSMRGSPQIDAIVARTQLGVHGSDIHVVMRLPAEMVQGFLQEMTSP